MLLLSCHIKLGKLYARIERGDVLNPELDEPLQSISLGADECVRLAEKTDSNCFGDFGNAYYRMRVGKIIVPYNTSSIP